LSEMRSRSNLGEEGVAMKRYPLFLIGCVSFITLGPLAAQWVASSLIHKHAEEIKKKILASPGPDDEPSQPTGKLYPYSLLLGGVGNGHELRRRVTADPIVKLHYAGFDTGHAHLATFRKDQWMYVSYRMDERVAWTRTKKRIAKTEVILTDGQHQARTRCANRLSFVPQHPMLSPDQQKQIAPLFDREMPLPGNPLPLFTIPAPGQPVPDLPVPLVAEVPPSVGSVPTEENSGGIGPIIAGGSGIGGGLLLAGLLSAGQGGSPGSGGIIAPVAVVPAPEPSMFGLSIVAIVFAFLAAIRHEVFKR
jgi:hypothetical protein